MTPSRPYLLRGLFEWIKDNAKTPYIVVDADMPDVHVPQEYVNDGRIIFNISPDAVDDLMIDNIALKFYASFSGISRHVSVPIAAIQAVYAQENGAGMVFGEEPGGELPPDNSKFGVKTASAKKPHLKIVKSD
jgi:stringent starvation protein B